MSTSNPYALAVRAVVDFDMSQADAAEQYGVSNTTMSQWVSLYREGYLPKAGQITVGRVL